VSTSNFPFTSTNTFGISSANTFQLSLFNPYSLYYYTVTVVSPLIPDADEDEIEVPDVTFRDFLTWCGQFLDIDDEQHALYHLAVALIDIAKEYVDVNLIGQASYKRAVCLYAGHYLEMHMRILKEEANTTNFNPENKDKTIELQLPQGSKGDFAMTVSGQMFWSVYGHIARFAGSDDETVWGAF
jgi:hypothetical protein